MDFDADQLNPYEEDDERIAAAFDDGEEYVVEDDIPPPISSDPGPERPFAGSVDDSADNELKPSFDHHRDSSPGKLFVGGISWETTEETFADYFSKYGEITDSVIMKDRHSGRPRGFGFVTFADTVVADKVLAKEHVIDGRAVEVKRTVPREDVQVKGPSKTKKIFIGGIPPSFSEDELKEYFSTYGSIVEHQIMLDHNTGRPRGFGFVTFETEETVDRIFSEDKLHELGGKQVEIKRAEPKRGGGSDYGGSSARSNGSFGAAAKHGSSYGSTGAYTEKMSRAYGDYGGYVGAYGGGYGSGSAGFYGGYGGYGYGFGFGGPMYGGAALGGLGYGNLGVYGSGSGYGVGRGYGTGGAGGGGFGSSKGYGSGSATTPGRFHPYRK